MSYLKYREIPFNLGIKDGDVILVSSDITNIFSQCLEYGEDFDINNLIDSFIESVGSNGTILFPTYNWAFCKGETFNYHKTRSRTGALGQTALKRDDFKRTQHPIYSFAVYGQYQDYLCKMENVSSFGSDSPFAFFENIGAKNVIIDVHYNNCFTFMHYIEQKIGVTYRYEKLFEANYIDAEGIVSLRNYSMYVRNLDLNVVNEMSEMGNIFKAKGVAQHFELNGIEYKVVDLKSAVAPLENDVKNNRSRNICRYIGQ